MKGIAVVAFSLSLVGIQATLYPLKTVGARTIPLNEELNIFAGPFTELLEPKCANGDCEIKISSGSISQSSQSLTYEIIIYKIRPEFCCDIKVCRTNKNYGSQMPLEGIQNCFNSLSRMYPQFNNEGIDMSLSTWFMESDHYIDLVKTGYTSMVVPLSTTSKLPIFGSVHYTGRNIFCQYYSNGVPIETKVAYEGYKIKWFGMELPVNGFHSYLLTFNCSTETKSLIDDQLTLDIFKNKAIFITVKPDPSILFPDSQTFAIEEINQRIKLKVLSTNPILAISIAKLEDSLNEATITVRSILPKSYIIWYYWVTFHEFKLAFAGLYNITATISNGMKVSKTFRMIVSETRLEINPQKVMVGQGQNATFDCIAYGTDIQGVVWQRHGITNQSSSMVVNELITRVKNVVALRVSFFFVDYADSGEYLCSAWTSHPSHQTIRYADLLVFHPGSPHINPRHRTHNDLSLITHSNTLNVSGDQILKEWKIQQQGIGNDDPKVHLYIVGGIIAGIVVSIILSLACCCFICCWKAYRRKKTKTN